MPQEEGVTGRARRAEPLGGHAHHADPPLRVRQGLSGQPVRERYIGRWGQTKRGQPLSGGRLSSGAEARR